MFMTSHEIFGQKWEYFSKMIFLAVALCQSICVMYSYYMYTDSYF